MSIISVTEMARSLSEIIGRVHYKGEVFDIKKGNNIVARISPVKPYHPLIKLSDLNKFFSTAPKLDAEDVEDFKKELRALRKMSDTKSLRKWE
jgi:antitoxin (DNA-binding transcriptional repressor) of toxin-antitoxin stability system